MTSRHDRDPGTCVVSAVIAAADVAETICAVLAPTTRAGVSAAGNEAARPER